jgi:DNA-binding NtrC family response regulator
MRALVQYPWPGNVRELRSEVVRWYVFCPKRVDVEDLAPEISGSRTPSSSLPHHVATLHPPETPKPLADVVADAERAAVQAAFDHYGGNLSQTARALRIDRNTLKRKLSSYGMR